MPKTQEKNNSPPKASVSNAGLAQANTWNAAAASQKNPTTNTDSGDIIGAINKLKDDVNGHND